MTLRTRIALVGYALAALLVPFVASAGSQSYTSPGTYQFTVPDYTGTLTVTVRGAGGGGSGGSGGGRRYSTEGDSGSPGGAGQPGGNGGGSSFGVSTPVHGNGGAGALGGDGGGAGGQGGVAGSNGGAKGGDTHTTGSGGAGGAGGAGGFTQFEFGACLANDGARGGNGGRAVKNWTPSTLAPGSTITITVGGGGAGGAGGSPGTDGSGNPCPAAAGDGGKGQSGSVTISWQDNAPSCTISFGQNPIASGSYTHIQWSSTGADLFYIENIGYVGASGSAQVSPSQTTDYSGSVIGASGTGNCAVTLGVAGSSGGGRGGAVGGGACTTTTFNCRADGNLSDNCGRTVLCPAGCSARTNRCNCVQSRVCSTDTLRVLNSCDGSLVENCAARGSGWRCVSGACSRPSAAFHSFSGTWHGQSFTASGHLQVVPSLVSRGSTAQVYWNVLNALACSVVGSNGDGLAGSNTGIWNMPFSGAAGKTTGGILFQTVYTLSCVAFDGSPIRDRAVVDIAPTFQEQ